MSESLGIDTEQVRTLGPDRFAAAARLLAEAFFTNPAHTFIFPEPETRAARLRWLLGANLKRQPDLSESFCLTDGPDVIAMGFWTRSTTPKPGLLAMLRAGILAAPLRVGMAGFQRALESGAAIDSEVALALGDQPHWYLNNMAVAESLRGKGVGGELLGRQLERIGKIEPAFPVGLSTQRPENVTFYQRLGFEPVRDETVCEGPGSFRNWTMVRAAAG